MFDVSDGLATLGPDSLGVIGLLERRFAAWAREVGAREHAYPALLPVEALSGIDYFENFPHLGALVSAIRPEQVGPGYARRKGAFDAVPGADLQGARYALPSAACYGAYFALRGSTLPGVTRVSTVARCFRNEAEYVGLRRLRSFQMREIVCLGDAGSVQEHLRSFRARVGQFAAEIGLPLDVSVATDPFFDASSSRAKMQQVFPVKEEFLYGGSLAVASVNFHRNFFGERCGIKAPDGSPAFTGCVAFGLERWLGALADRFGGLDRAAAALESA